LLEKIINVLAPFYDATKMLSSISYSTLNLVYPTMSLLKKEVALDISNDCIQLFNEPHFQRENEIIGRYI